jgi:hypothetical protein
LARPKRATSEFVESAPARTAYPGSIQEKFLARNHSEIFGQHSEHNRCGLIGAHKFHASVAGFAVLAHADLHLIVAEFEDRTPRGRVGCGADGDCEGPHIAPHPLGNFSTSLKRSALLCGSSSSARSYREGGITEQTDYRWRKEDGGLQVGLGRLVKGLRKQCGGC